VTIALPTQEIRVSIPVAIALVIVLSVATIMLYRVITTFVDAPAEFFRWRAMGRRRRGFAAVTKGLVAVAAGDDDEARRQSRKALSLVGEPPLALLLAAQAAQMEGDEEAAQRYFTQMLQSRDTEFLGLRGLFMSAMRRGDTDQALLIAERARLLRPKTRWALAALFDLNVSKRRWTEAAAAVDLQMKARQLDPPSPSAGAPSWRQQMRRQPSPMARVKPQRSSLKTHSHCPRDFGPAAIIAARGAAAQGKLWRAASLIETAWTQGPHPDLAKAYAAMRPEELPPARAKRLSGLASMNPHHVESRILNAAASLSQGRHEEAKEFLRPLAERQATVRVCMMMSEVERGLGGDSLIASDWATRALKAPRDAQWACGACLRTQNEWAAVCSSCDGFDTLSWQSGTAPGAGSDPVTDSVSVYAEVVENAAPLYRNTVKRDPAAPSAPVRPEYSPTPSDGNVVYGTSGIPDDPGPDAEDYTQSGDDKRRKRSGIW
jgi:HemY protein